MNKGMPVISGYFDAIANGPRVLYRIEQTEFTHHHFPLDSSIAEIVLDFQTRFDDAQTVAIVHQGRVRVNCRIESIYFFLQHIGLAFLHFNGTVF
jgi:hypothetical protein